MIGSRSGETRVFYLIPLFVLPPRKGSSPSLEGIYLISLSCLIAEPRYLASWLQSGVVSIVAAPWHFLSSDNARAGLTHFHHICQNAASFALTVRRSKCTWVIRTRTKHSRGYPLIARMKILFLNAATLVLTITNYLSHSSKPGPLVFGETGWV